MLMEVRGFESEAARTISRREATSHREPKRGWTIVSMKRDWRVVFAPGK